MHGMYSPLKHSDVLTDAKASGWQIRIRGQVQGVGFRPFVWHVANTHHLTGEVLNDGNGVLIHVYGNGAAIKAFIDDLSADVPPLAEIESIEVTPVAMSAANDFSIVSSHQSSANTSITPDAATCPGCLADIQQQHNRRFGYAFTNCTHCGPRLSIVRAIPYDRQHTSMAVFTQCSDCQAEYDNPENRRFHAQPNACPQCGPKLWLQLADKTITDDAIQMAAQCIKQGKILAIKGIGGFHLVCDALNEEAVSLLRSRKKRPAKAFALMARDVNQVRCYAEVNGEEAHHLQSSAAPIVLLDALENNNLACDVAPGLTSVGIMLPNTPLHHLLLQQLDGPIVATSANMSALPPCIDNETVQQQLSGIADAYLLHDRDIVNRVDDSVIRVVKDQMQMLRRSRGYAPASITLPQGFENAPEVLAYGSELKNTFCLLKSGHAILSQHMGDLENLQTYQDYLHNIDLYQNLYPLEDPLLAVDMHPDYLSTKLGKETSAQKALPIVEVQHHHAHIASCLVENQWPLHDGKVIGIALDGIGYGDDNALWGGEILLADYCGFERLGHLAPVALPGGSLAMKQPWRNLVAQLHHAFGVDWAKHSETLNLPLQQKSADIITNMIEQGFNSPQASSTGRLFDAVAAAIGICSDKIDYEGQAAIELESQTDVFQCEARVTEAYPFNIDYSEVTGSCQIDSAALWPTLLADINRGESIRHISSRFHAGLAHAFTDVAKHYARQYQINTIVLSGGVLQNRVLSQMMCRYLKEADLNVLIHQKVPANDGGLSLGQAAIAAATKLTEANSSCV